MTAPTCENPVSEVSAALARLKDVTTALHEAQGDVRSISAERRELVAALRSQGVTLRAIGTAMGTTATAAWLLTRAETGEEASA